MGLPNGRPRYRSASSDEHEARHRPQFEHVDFVTGQDRVTQLAAPAGIRVGCQFVCLCSGRWECICVGFVVVGKWEMYEGGGRCWTGQVERDAIINGTPDVFDNVYGSVHMPFSRIVVVGCEEGGDGGKIWPSCGGEPVEASDVDWNCSRRRRKAGLLSTVALSMLSMGKPER